MPFCYAAVFVRVQKYLPEIHRYAEKRGVNVLAEIDVPGHALSW
jgi:N-acetyl-beta-hexosaminidase